MNKLFSMPKLGRRAASVEMPPAALHEQPAAKISPDALGATVAPDPGAPYPARQSGFVGLLRVSRPVGITTHALKKLLAADGYAIGREPTTKAIAEDAACRIALPANSRFDNGLPYAVVWRYKFLMDFLGKKNALGNAGFGIHSVRSAEAQLVRAAEEIAFDPHIPAPIRDRVTAIRLADHGPLASGRDSYDARRAAVDYVTTLTEPLLEYIAGAPATEDLENAKRRIANVKAWFAPYTPKADAGAKAGQPGERKKRPYNRRPKPEAASAPAAKPPIMQEAAWIEQHGSRRLKMCFNEGIPYEEILREEMAAHQKKSFGETHPQWSLYTPEKATHMKLLPPSNPPESAFDLLEKARAADKNAALMALEITGDGATIKGWGAILSQTYADAAEPSIYIFERMLTPKAGA